MRTWPSRRKAMCLRFEKLGVEITEADSEIVETAIAATELAQIRREKAGAPRMSDEDFLKMADAAAAAALGIPETAAALSGVPLPKQELRLIDGVTAMLERLKAAGMRLAIVSNHYKWLRGELERLCVAKYFETIVISEEAGVEKPDPEILNIALRGLNLAARDCIYIGDHPYDVLCAGRAGMDCAWIAPPDAALPHGVPYVEKFRISSAAEIVGRII